MVTDREITILIWCIVVFIISIYIRLKYLKHESVIGDGWSYFFDPIIVASGFMILVFIYVFSKNLFQ